MVPTVLVNLAIELNLRIQYTAKRMPNQCNNEVPQAAVITSCKKVVRRQDAIQRLDALNTPWRYWTVVRLPIENFRPIPSLNQRATSITSLPVCIPFQICRHHLFRSIRWSKGSVLIGLSGKVSVATAIIAAY